MAKPSKPQEPRKQASGSPSGLGPRVRELRQKKGMTQDRLALEAGLDQSGLSKFERGTHALSFSAIERIAKVLQLDSEELLRPSDTEDP